jgi:hypothetical protein
MRLMAGALHVCGDSGELELSLSFDGLALDDRDRLADVPLIAPTSKQIN